MIRAFIAVDLPEALRQETAAFEGELQRAGADIKWVEPDNLHLTLKFLGSVSETQVPSLIGALQPACAGHPPFTLTLEGIGAFPRTTRPRVIWVGVTDGKEALSDLARSVEEACNLSVLRQAQHEREPLTLSPLKEERPFSPHLTIGRARSQEGIARLVKQLQVAEFKGRTPAPVDRLVLYQSTLSSQGPTYTKLAEIPLG